MLHRSARAPGAAAALVLLAAFVVGCGPTAEVITTLPPGAPRTGLPSTPVPLPGTARLPGTATDRPIPVTSPSSGSIAPSSVEPVLPTAPVGEVWQPLLDFPVSDAFEVTGVTTTPTGFVAVGFRAMPGEGPVGRSQGVVWTSSDGRTWEAHVDPIFEFVTLEEVAAIGDSVVAFGSLETCDLEDVECVEPVEAGWGIWRSVAGGPWERLAPPESMRAGTMDRLTVAHGSLVAAGWSGIEGQSAIVWRSADGVTWTETTDLSGMDTVDAIGESPSGIVAFGSRYSGELGDAELVAAASADGSVFAPVAIPALPATTVQSVAARPSGVIAVGDADDIDSGFHAVSLFSNDGVAWTQAGAPDGSFVGTQLHQAHAVPQGFIALGYTPDVAAGTTAGASWISADGLTWRYLGPLDAGAFALINASAVGPTGVVAFTISDVGFDDEPGTSEISAWFAPIEAMQP